jgi:preprotein translocase subunit SecF
MEFIGKTRIDFMGMKKVSFIISAIISIIGIFAIIQISLGSANMGTDFTGGTVLQLRFQKPIPMDQARRALTGSGLEVSLQEIKDGNQILIKVGKSNVAMGKVSDAVQEVFRKEFAANPFTVESSSEIGPSIGEKLRNDTLIAVLIAFVGIILYIAWRFDFKFGISAVVATAHDVLAIFAVFYLLNKEINLLLITAVLTIAGYSLTDTVVVFDRIRENLHKNLKESLHNIFNASINEVLSRTIITGLTTLLSALSLFFLGGEVIHDFAFALSFGVIIGTYSSIFVASPIVELLENRAKPAKA